MNSSENNSQTASGSQKATQRKRKLSDTNNSNNEEHSSIVAAHYNHIEELGFKERCKSPIYYLRNFNNWVKSVLIKKYVTKVSEKDYGKPLRVLDICCGKGGDLMKWQRVKLKHVVFADIAEVSVQQCRARYEDVRRWNPRMFTAEFIAADCTKDTLRDKYEDPSIKFDFVSCQFGLHYSFESLSQARKMLFNISECLRPGGYFIGTIPNADEIVSKAKKSPDNSFGNRVFKIKLLFDPADGYPYFGAKYDFQLEGVVNCPEFLVDFKILVKLAAEYGLELVYKAGFADFFTENLDAYKPLLHKIMCFESYPAPPGSHLMAEESEYDHAREKWDEMSNKNEHERLGTMSKSEWEVATLYMVFVFTKCKSSWNKNGEHSYVTSKDVNVTAGNK